MNKKTFDPYEFSKKEISGVPVYYKNLPWAPCIHIRVVFNTGAFNDPVGKEGMSHFLEHMIFDGCPSLPDKKAIKAWSKLNALNTWNAWTSFDETAYWLECLPEKFNTAISGMKDMIFNSFFRSEDVEHERKVITQESWGRFVNEKFLAYNKQLLKNLFHGHVHSRFATALGWPETIAKISREDVISWHKQNYGIGNMFIILTGDVEEKHIDGLKDFLKDLPKVNKKIEDCGLLGKPEQKSFVKTADEIGQIKEQVEISVFRVSKERPYNKNEIDNLSRKLIYDILYERLRIENSLCYGVNVNSFSMKNYFQVFMCVKTEEKNIELVEKEFKNVINEIIDKKYVTRFETIKKMYLEQMKSQEFLSEDITDSTLSEIVRFNGHIVTQKEQLEEAEKVTYDNVAEFTKWAFDPDYVFTEIILPSKK